MLMLVTPVAAQNYNLDWLSINSGGQMSQASVSYAAKLTLAQPVAGLSESDNYRAYLGFWYPNLGIALAVEQVESPTLPTAFSLEQNFPNPFNPTTTIEFAIPRSGQVRIEIFNLLGQLVAMLFDQAMPAGRYRTVWDSRDLWGNDVASGVYIYRLVAEDRILTRKMVLMK